jgi:hypothetical protein
MLGLLKTTRLTLGVEVEISLTLLVGKIQFIDGRVGLVTSIT